MIPLRFKAVPTSEPLNRASVSLWEATSRGKVADFSHFEAVKQFRSWIAAAAMINANAVASVPLRLYAKKRASSTKLFNTRAIPRHRKAWLAGDQQQTPSRTVMTKAANMGEMEEVIDAHPITDLLHQVNPFANGFDFAVHRILAQEITGNAYVLMIRPSDSLPPTELWPLLPQYTTIIPSRENWISGYLYDRNGVDAMTFAPEDVIHFRQPSMTSLYYGTGKVERAWGVVQLNEADHAKDIALSMNHGRPDYAVIMEGATPEQAGVMQDSLDKRLKGRHKAGRSLVLGGPKVSLMPLNFPPKDMVGRDDTVEEIAAVFGVPVSMLKANDPNLASSKIGYAQWREGSILPLCRQDEQALNQHLVPLYSDDLMLAYDNPVPADVEQSERVRASMVAGARLTPNEGRIEEGYPAMDDPAADRLWFNGQPLGGYAPLPGAAPTINVNQPATPPAVEGEAVPVGDDQQIQTTEAAVLNGAQISSAMQIVLAVAGGKLPRDSGLGMIQTFFNLTSEKAEQIMGSAGTSTPTTPNPIPTTEQVNGTGNSDSVSGGSGGGQPGDGVSDGAEGGSEDDDGDDAKAVGRERAGANGSKANASASASASANAIPDQGDAGFSDAASNNRRGRQGVRISQKALMNGAACLHHKADAADNIREEEPDSPAAKLARQLAAIFERQRQAVAGAVEGGKAMVPGHVKELSQSELDKLLSDFDADIDAAIKPFLDSMVATGGKVGDDKLTAAGASGFDPFDVQNPKVGEFLDSYTVRLRSDLQSFTGEALSQFMKRQLENGASTAEIARNLRNTETIAGGSLAPGRAEVIARTESARAYVEGQRLAWQQSDVVEGKQWLLAPDACPFCEAAAAKFNGKNVKLDEPFFAKGSTLTAADGSTMVLDYSDVQGAPLHPNCRCDIVPVIKGI